MLNILVAVAAQGTRGDVQPVYTIAQQLQCHDATDVHVAFITHAAHKAWLQQLSLELDTAGRALQLLFISSLPAAVWETAQHGIATPPGSTSSQDLTRAELLQHCCTALQLHLPASALTASAAAGAGEDRPAAQLHTDHEQSPHQHDHQQQTRQEAKSGGQHQHQQPQPQRLLLFNLFALEAYSIAEKLQVPCCVVQPYLVPYSMPSGFLRRLRSAAPAMVAQLETTSEAAEAEAPVAPPEAAGDDDASGLGSQVVAPPVSLKDVSHWMWPLFTERWGSWRQEVLGLQPWPLTQALGEHWQGCIFASTVAAGGGAAGGADAARAGLAEQHQSTPAPPPPWQAAAAASGPAKSAVSPASTAPSAVPVLYGLSPAVVTQPGFWPGSVHMCGFWLTSRSHQHQQKQCVLPAALQTFLGSCGSTQQQQQQQLANHQNHRSHLLVVDFGSMGALGLLRDAGTLLHVLLHALLLLGPLWKCVLLTGGWAPLLQAQQTLLAQQNTAVADAAASHTTPHHQQQSQPEVLLAALPRLFVQHESLACHHLLLEAASVLLHHGGSGTTAAALAAGVPQLVCPLQFDQFYWADRVADLGCSPGALAADKLLGPAAPTVATVQPAPQAAAVDDPPSQQARTTPSHLPAAATQQVSAAAAGSYLASKVLAARQPPIVEACRDMKQELAKEDGLQAAVRLVQSYLRQAHGQVPGAS